MLFELYPWSANKNKSIILRVEVTLKDNFLLGFHISNQKIKQKAVGMELKALKGAIKLHFDAYASQRCSK